MRSLDGRLLMARTRSLCSQPRFANRMSIICECHVEFSRGVVVAKRNEAWTMTLLARWTFTWSVPALFAVIDANTFNSGDVLVLLEDFLTEKQNQT